MAEELTKEQEEYIVKIQQLKQDYTDVFGSERSKRVMEDLAKHCFVNKTTFSQEPTQLAFNEGQRSVLLHIQNMQRLDVERTKKLMLEQKEIANE